MKARFGVVVRQKEVQNFLKEVISIDDTAKACIVQDSKYTLIELETELSSVAIRLRSDVLCIADPWNHCELNNIDQEGNLI